MEITIGGHVYKAKALTELCGRETSQQYVDLVSELADAMTEYDKRIHVLTQLVTAWDWPGNPADPEAWQIVPHHQQFRIITEARELFNPKN